MKTEKTDRKQTLATIDSMLAERPMGHTHNIFSERLPVNPQTLAVLAQGALKPAELGDATEQITKTHGAWLRGYDEAATPAEDAGKRAYVAQQTDYAQRLMRGEPAKPQDSWTELDWIEDFQERGRAGRLAMDLASRAITPFMIELGTKIAAYVEKVAEDMTVEEFTRFQTLHIAFEPSLLVRTLRVAGRQMRERLAMWADQGTCGKPADAAAEIGLRIELKQSEIIASALKLEQARKEAHLEEVTVEIERLEKEVQSIQRKDREAVERYNGIVEKIRKGSESELTAEEQKYRKGFEQLHANQVTALRKAGDALAQAKKSLETVKASL